MMHSLERPRRRGTAGPDRAVEADRPPVPQAVDESIGSFREAGHWRRQEHGLRGRRLPVGARFRGTGKRWMTRLDPDGEAIGIVGPEHRDLFDSKEFRSVGGGRSHGADHGRLRVHRPDDALTRIGLTKTERPMIGTPREAGKDPGSRIDLHQGGPGLTGPPGVLEGQARCQRLEEKRQRPPT